MRWLINLLKKSDKEGIDISIREGISGYYYYHIAINEIPLCGNKNTMKTELPLASWEIKSHIGETYCKECEELWVKRKKK